MDTYIPPAHSLQRFNCPQCGAFAHHEWYTIIASNQRGNNYELPDYRFTKCQCCLLWAAWRDKELIFPATSTARLPSPDMPDEIKADYLEARAIANQSPRGAAALLRLAVQKLMPILGEKGKNINDDIAALVTKGLRADIAKALDTVRVIGNNAVHPGEPDLNDNPETAHALFNLVNIIIDDRITQPKRIEDLYKTLPQNARDAIQKRDKT